MAAPIELEDFRLLTGRLLASVLDQSQWQVFLGDLAAVTGGGTCTHILAKDTARNLHLGDLTHGYDPVWGPPYYQHFHAINPWLTSAEVHPVGRAIYSYDMCPDDVFERSEFYADWVRPQEDIIAGGSIAIAQTRTQVFKLGACIRRKDRAAVEDRFVTIIDLLAGPLSHAWEVSRRIAADGLTALAGRPASPAAAILLLDADGRLRFATPAAEGELADGRRVRLSPASRIKLSDAQADLNLGRMLAAVRTGNTAWWRGVCGSAEVALAALPDGLSGEGLAALILGAGRPAVLVVLTEPEAGDAAERLTARLGLTRAEAEVALALASEGTPAEIAAARGASLHTVRNQIKSAMSKCGARRQAELVALVLRETR